MKNIPMPALNFRRFALNQASSLAGCKFGIYALLVLISVNSQAGSLVRNSNSKAEKCESVFVVEAGTEIANLVSEKSISNFSNAGIQALSDFSKTALQGKSVTAVAMDFYSQKVAVQHYDEASKTWILSVVDLKTQAVVSSESFSSISNFDFVGTNGVLYVNGAKASDGQIRKVYLRHTDGQSRTVMLKGDVGRSLQMPGSKYWGVDLKQLILREDLPFAVAVQDSMNPIGDAPAPTDYNPQAVTSIANQQTHFLDLKTGRVMKELKYGPLRPISVTLNPTSSLAAMVIINPLAAAAKTLSMQIVDLVNPEKVLLTETADFATLEFTRRDPSGRVLYNHGERNDFLNAWSPDGRRLLIAETGTGHLALYDSRLNKIIYRHKFDHAERWPVLQILPLSQDRFVILRAGLSPVDSSDKGILERNITAEILDLKSKVNPVAKFPVQLNTADEFYQSYYKQGRVEAFSFSNGNVILIALDGQLIRIPLAEPKDQKLLVAPIKQRSSSAAILSVQKADEHTLIFSTDQGVFRWEL